MTISGGKVAALPQPFKVKFIADPPPREPGAPDWSGAIKQLRTVAQWVIGGVVATAAGVFAGGSLSNIGAMSFTEDADRLWLAIYGVSAGFLAIATIMFFGLSVLAPRGHNLDNLAAAKWPSPDKAARDAIYGLEQVDQARNPLPALLAQPQNPATLEYLPRFFAVAPFCAVRARFNRLIACMVICVPIAIAGFGLFAWAANPPDKPSAPERGLVVKITY